METKSNETSLKDKKRGTPAQGNPYEKFFSGGLEAPVDT
jgi:hypothetical protein